MWVLTPSGVWAATTAAANTSANRTHITFLTVQPPVVGQSVEYDLALEAHLRAELQNARLRNQRRQQPPRAVRVGGDQDVARVQRVVEVEVRLHAHPVADAERLRHAYIEPGDAILELGLRHDQ